MPRIRPIRAADEDGYALAVVIVLAAVMSVLATTAFIATRNTQLDSREQRNVTSARGVADGGAEQIIYELGLTGSQWNDYPTLYPSEASAKTGTLGDGTWKAWVSAAGDNTRVITAQGTYPAGSDDTVTVRVEVRRNAPAAFDFAMFADQDITIHHHSGSTWLAPRVFTTGVHSNGNTKIDASAEFTVTDAFETVGLLEMPAKTASVGDHPNLSFGGGDVPTGDYPTGGYTWRYDIGNGDLCYPGAIPHGEPGHNVDHTVGNNGCDGEDRFFGGVRINGTVEVGGLHLDTAGLIDGDAVVDDDGTFDIAAGTITGDVVRSVEPPPTIEFPTLDYENTYKLRAAEEELESTCPVSPPSRLSCDMPHLFTADENEDESDFFAEITDPANGLYRKADHTVWAKSDGGEPAYIVARGDWYIEGGIKFDVDAIKNAMAAHGITVSGAVPPVIIAGSLITPDDGITAQGRLFVVGRGNRTDFLDPSQPEGVDLDKFLDDTPVTGFTSVEPGILAAGKKIDGKDYDDDSPWETTSELEADKQNATWIRGLVYTGKYDASVGASEAGDQHWHNYDPKNEARIYGAQVGAKLHNCNNFEFTYDDVVLNAFGFTSSTGSVEVISWDER